MCMSHVYKANVLFVSKKKLKTTDLDTEKALESDRISFL